MKNFGLSNLHLVNPLTQLGSHGRARGGHAQDVLDSAISNESLLEALEGLDLSVGTTAQRSFSEANLLRKSMTVRDLKSVVQNSSGTVGLVFGREGTGLNNAELGLCDGIVSIPTADEYQTLNLSHAAAIVFYELYDVARVPDGDLLATEEVKKTILGYLSNSATLAGLEEYRVGLTIRAFRNVLGRSGLRWREGSLLAGTLRHISEALAGSKTATPTLREAGEIAQANPE